MVFYGGKKSGKHSSGGGKASAAKRTAPRKSTRDEEEYSVPPHDEPEEFTAREEKKSGRRWVRNAIITIGLIALVVIGAYTVFKLWAASPDVSAHNPTVQDPNQTVSPDAAPGAADIDAQAPTQAVTSDRRDGTYTFAVIGKDVVGNNTDTILVGMLDTKAGALNVVSIPRDTLVNTGYDRKKINYIYPACVNNGKDGLDALLGTLENMLGYRVDCYALVDVEAAQKLVDAIGGVWFDVPQDMDWDAWDQDPPCYIHIKKGYQLLDGDNFVKVMRFRHSDVPGQSYAGGDIDRIAMQHNLLMALAKQMLTLGNLPNIGKFVNIYEESVETNVTASNIAFFAEEFFKLDSDAITFDTLPANYWGQLYGEGYCFPYIDEWLAMVNAKLNPFTSDITSANIDMITSDGTTVTGTQGYIKGGIESFAGYTP